MDTNTALYWQQRYLAERRARFADRRYARAEVAKLRAQIAELEGKLNLHITALAESNIKLTMVQCELDDFREMTRTLRYHQPRIREPESGPLDLAVMNDDERREFFRTVQFVK